MDFLHTRMCFGKFWEQQEKFYDTKNFLKNFVKKFTFCGGGVNANLEKVYILIFFAPFPKDKYKKEIFYVCKNNT